MESAERVWLCRTALGTPELTGVTQAATASRWEESEMHPSGKHEGQTLPKELSERTAGLEE